MFKRRDKRSFGKKMLEAVYPKGGWRRAAKYIRHRLLRLPDDPRRIARGLFAGTFTCFMPFIGVDVIMATLLAYALRGNIFAAIVATLISNPVTTPFIAVFSVGLGHWLLGNGDGMPAWQILAAFGRAGAEVLYNLQALFNDNATRWTSLADFFRRVYFPYMLGGALPGIVAGLISYFLSLSVIRAYQHLRSKRLAERSAVLGKRPGRKGGDDAGAGKP